MRPAWDHAGLEHTITNEGRMKKTNQTPTETAVAGEQAPAAPTLPRSVQGIRALIAEAITCGVSLGQELEPEITAVYLKHGPDVSAEDWAGCDAQLDRVLDQLVQAGAEKLPTYCHASAPAARHMAMALHHGLLRGMETYIEALVAEELDRPLGDWCALMPADPEWVLEAADEILHLLLAVLDAIRIPVPGATKFLLRDQAQVLRDRQMHSWLVTEDTWEARTTWIASPDGFSHQWAIQRREDQVHLSRRTIIGDPFEPVCTLRPEDIAPLAEVLSTARATGMRAS